MNPILVTGGAKGLGAEICHQLAKRGHDLVIHYRESEKNALKVAEECRLHHVVVETIAGDFNTSHSLQHFLSEYTHRFAQTKGIVNNVGSYLLASLSETSMSQWQELFQVNFFAPLMLNQALLPLLRKEKGCIVNVGLTGLQGMRGFKQMPAYATSKAALFSYTLSLAKELAEEGVRVNMVSPGYMENAVDSVDFSKLPFKRAAYLHEAAHLVALFFDSAFDYITGQNIEVAGGVGL